VLTNVREIVGIELLSATQGLIFRQPLLPGLPLQGVVKQLRAKGIEPLYEDRVLYPDMRRMQVLMRDPELLQALAE
jgi:histidine ammonia-lyase